MSIASPKACIDHVLGPLDTAARQLNADVLSAAIDLLSSPPYAAIGTIWRIGKRAAYIMRSAETTADTTRKLTTSVPVCERCSKPQKVTAKARNDEAPTGQPARQL